MRTDSSCALYVLKHLEPLAKIIMKTELMNQKQNDEIEPRAALGHGMGLPDTKPTMCE